MERGERKATEDYYTRAARAQNPLEVLVSDPQFFAGIPGADFSKDVDRARRIAKCLRDAMDVGVELDCAVQRYFRAPRGDEVAAVTMFRIVGTTLTQPFLVL